MARSTSGVDAQEALRLLLVAEAHDALDAGAVVPAAIEEHDLARRRASAARSAAGTSGSSRDRVGAGSATTRKTRGLTRSVIALIVPPLPAPSRPSKTTHTLSPACTTHCCSLTSSPCRRASSLS